MKVSEVNGEIFTYFSIFEKASGRRPEDLSLLFRFRLTHEKFPTHFWSTLRSRTCLL
jgi:hypothetical protein